MRHQPAHRHGLPGYLRPGRAVHAPAPPENEDGGKGHDAQSGKQGRHHGRLGVARGARQEVEAQHEEAYGRKHHQRQHELVGIAQRVAACAEEHEQRIKENPEQHAEDQAEDDFQHHGMPQHAPRLDHVLAPEFYGAQRRAAHGHQLTEGHEQVDERKGDGHGRKGQMPHAVADVDGGNDLVEGHDDHAENGGNGIFEKKAAHALRSHFIGFVVGLRHCPLPGPLAGPAREYRPRIPRLREPAPPAQPSQGAP